MVSPAAANFYCCANVLLALALLFLAGVTAASSRLRRPLTYRHQLHLSHMVTAAAILLPVVNFVPGPLHRPLQILQIWSAPTMHAGGAVTRDAHQVAVSFASSGTAISWDVVSQAAVALFLAGLLLVLVRLATDAMTTWRMIVHAPVIRRHRSLRILASDRARVPFSFWLPGRHFIVVPSALVLRAEDLKMALRHEAQHHRQGDTRWLYGYALLKAVFFWNPAVYRLERHLRELQEFACDEALSRRNDVVAQDYCHCLLQVAEAASRQRETWVHAGMVGGRSDSILRRRVRVLLARPTHYLDRPAMASTTAVALILMAATAAAFASIIHDRRISAADVVKMAAIVQLRTAFPVAANARVLEQLNLLLATPDGRADLNAGLERMQRHRALISREIGQRGLPLDLLAVPLVESGYRNLPRTDSPSNGAGLWMFIAPTARRFGLTVDEKQDDRLDVARETGAAVRLLTNLHRQFNDWGLALLAYNAGSARVERAIRETGSTDVWHLIEQGYENDPGYVPRTIAAALVLKNPVMLDR